MILFFAVAGAAIWLLVSFFASLLAGKILGWASLASGGFMYFQWLRDNEEQKTREGTSIGAWKRVTRILLVVAPIAAAFLFIDHRHNYLLPDVAYCWFGMGYSHSGWECPPGYYPPTPLMLERADMCPGLPYTVTFPMDERSGTRWLKKEPLPTDKIATPVPVIYRCHHGSVWENFVKLMKLAAGSPYHR